MVGSRTLTALAGLVVSLAVSLAVWWYFDALFLFFFVPFVPFLFARGRSERPPVRECPTCGFSTRDPGFDYCPRDGAELAIRDGDGGGDGDAGVDGDATGRR